MNNKEKKWARRYRMVVLKVFIETSFKKWHTLQVLNNKSNWSSSWLWKMNYVKANGSRHRCLMLRGESCATVSEYQHGYNVVLKGNRVRKNGEGDIVMLCVLWQAMQFHFLLGGNGNHKRPLRRWHTCLHAFKCHFVSSVIKTAEKKKR